MRLLVADDEREITKAVRAALEHNKYTVDVVDNGVDALAYAQETRYDGIVLDIMMPGRDGLSVLQELRRGGVATPVLLLTARGELDDRIVGLEAGADDYLPKPFALAELVARVKALLRRGGDYTMDVIEAGDLRLNCSTYELSARETVRMSNKEFQIIECFLRHPHQVFSSEELLSRFWNWDSEAEINVVWTNIANLRRKLAQIGSTVEIKSIRGVGYQLEA